MSSVTGRVAVVITCEHGGNLVPAKYRPLFRGRAKILASHRGYDPGALEMARYLARALDAPLYASRVTRLLVDLNRSVGHRALFSVSSRPPDRAARDEILERFYYPHRDRIERHIADLVGRGNMVVHVASHSFVPVLDGNVRRADVAWLYDPRRPNERNFCRRSRDALAELRPDLRLRRNYPYRGDTDGLTSHLRKKLGPARYVGIELEVNQSWVYGGRRRWQGLKRSVAKAFAATI